MKLIFDIETDDLDATKGWCIVAKELDGKSYRFTPNEIEEGIKILRYVKQELKALIDEETKDIFKGKHAVMVNFRPIFQDLNVL